MSLNTCFIKDSIYAYVDSHLLFFKNLSSFSPVLTKSFFSSVSFFLDISNPTASSFVFCNMFSVLCSFQIHLHFCDFFLSKFCFLIFANSYFIYLVLFLTISTLDSFICTLWSFVPPLFSIGAIASSSFKIYGTIFGHSFICPMATL